MASYGNLPVWSKLYFRTVPSLNAAKIYRRSLYVAPRPVPRKVVTYSKPAISTKPFYPRIIQPRSVRTIFIQTETTPNADALKFLPNQTILPHDSSTPFLEYLSPRSTISAPHPSPLAARLLNIDGITSVFYGSEFITVTKAADASWAHVKPEVFSLITEAVTSGEKIVNTIEDRNSEADQEGGSQDTLAYNQDDSEVISLIKELLETRIRPAIQEDGGDIEFRGFENARSHLKNGIESMLMHYIEEVRGVIQVLDQEEEVAIKEFAKFEEKLNEQKGIASAIAKGL